MASEAFIPDFTKHLPQEFYLRPTEIIARELLGKVFVRRLPDGDILAARITETEAYVPHDDPANHACRGRTERNAAMFEDGGILYVYRIYGVHWCANIVTDSRHLGCAVLLRAGEPLAGIGRMKSNRNSEKLTELLKGPGNFAKAFELSRAENFHSLCSEDIFVQDTGNMPDTDIAVTGRIGISKAVDHPLRFIIRGSAFLSGKKSLNSQDLST